MCIRDSVGGVVGYMAVPSRWKENDLPITQKAGLPRTGELTDGLWMNMEVDFVVAEKWVQR
eukprot:5264480-Karenia_brevis.AAC.1